MESGCRTYNSLTRAQLFGHRAKLMTQWKTRGQESPLTKPGNKTNTGNKTYKINTGNQTNTGNKSNTGNKLIQEPVSKHVPTGAPILRGRNPSLIVVEDTGGCL